MEEKSNKTEIGDEIRNSLIPDDSSTVLYPYCEDERLNNAGISKHITTKGERLEVDIPPIDEKDEKIFI